MRNPDDYQSAAVEVAAKLLNERQVLQEDIERTDKYFQELQDKAKAKADKINSYKDKAADFFEPIIKPGTDVSPRKWLNILLLILGIDYLWTFYNAIRGFIFRLKCSYCGFDITDIFTLVNLIYIAVVFYLLLKKKRWGWILLFADNLFSFIARLSESYIFFKYQEIHRGDTGSFLLSIIIKAAFVFFLWRKAISDFFGVTAKTKKETVIVVTIIALVFVGIMQLV